MNQVNPFPTLTAPRSLIFCSNLSIAAKAPLAKEAARSIIVFLPKSPTLLPRDPPH